MMDSGYVVAKESKHQENLKSVLAQKVSNKIMNSTIKTHTQEFIYYVIIL